MNKFRIEYKGWHSYEKEFGDDSVSFDLDIYTDSQDNFSFPSFVSFHKLRAYLFTHDPSLAEYIANISKNIHSWGPRDSKIITELESSGVDLIKILKQYINNEWGDDLLQKECERVKNLLANPQKTQSDAKKIVADMSKGLPSIAQSQRNWKKLCENLEKTITDEILKIYPVITNSKPEHILELRDILIDNILKLSKEVSNLAYKAEQTTKRKHQ